MTSLRTHSIKFILGATAMAAIGAALVMPGRAGAAPQDGPWPEPPSCSNVTFTCTSIEDALAYECFFESEDALIKFCDDPFAELRPVDTHALAASQAGPPPAPKREVPPTTRR